MRIAQRDAAKTHSHRLDHDRPLAVCQHDAPQAAEATGRHGVADDGECFEPDLVARGDVIRRVEIARIDLLARHEAIELDRARVLDNRPRWRRRGHHGRRILALLCLNKLERRLAPCRRLLLIGRRCRCR
jgi:hypothetical protein